MTIPSKLKLSVLQASRNKKYSVKLMVSPEGKVIPFFYDLSGDVFNSPILQEFFMFCDSCYEFLQEIRKQGISISPYTEKSVETFDMFFLGD